jgi:hypothetical protein
MRNYRMIFIQKIFENKVDEEIHKQFVRFSKGTFKGRGTMKLSLVKDKLKVNASYDLAKDISRIIAGLSDKIQITGKVMKSKKKEEFDEEVSSERLLELMDDYEFTLLHLTAGEYSLKVGKSIPKPGKELKNNWCKAVLPADKVKDFAFDFDIKKRAEITHTLIIEDIIIPKEYEDNFEKARLFSKRKGNLIREIIVDGEEIQKETSFEI